MTYKFPLMHNNISRNDLDCLIRFLKKDSPKLTQSKNVLEFEKKWSKWLGVKYSVFVNSGSSANLLSMSILKELYNSGEIIVPSLTWVSDIVSVVKNNFTPVFVDINPKTLCMDENEIFKKINKNTKAVFITYAQGFNGLSDKLLKFLKKKSIPLIEDVCESHGATYKNKKLGSYGLMSNFSFYYAHHMSTIEGGMICTNNNKIYNILRMMRSHGLARESNDKNLIKIYKKKYKELNPEFIFPYSGYNVRSTELNAIIGLNQLKNLNSNIKKRNYNHSLFIKLIDKNKFQTDFELRGSSNYAFNLILKDKDNKLVNKLIHAMTKNKIEYRRGSAGGGNQLRQPYLKQFIKKNDWLNFPNTEHIHFYGFYLGNYPSLTRSAIIQLCSIINNI
jgi:CDP-4-dehydro-6-deoxyglucose reductase, E1